MYNTNALETFLGAVEGVRSDQRAADENRMRMRALDSQLANEKAERDNLPLRLDLESRKLEYEMSVGKLDMLLKVAGTVDQLQTAQLGREVQTWQFGEAKAAAPYTRELMKLQYQMTAVDAYYQPYEKAQQLTKMYQQNLFGPVYALSTWLTAMGPTLLQHANVIDKTSEDMKARTKEVVDGLVDRFPSGPRAGEISGWRDDTQYINALANFSDKTNGQRDPEDAVSAMVGQISMDWGARHETRDEKGNVTYKFNDEQTSRAELRGASDGQVARFMVNQAASWKPGKDERGSAEFAQARAKYDENVNALGESIKIAATKADGTIDQAKVKEINNKIDLLLYNNEDGAQAELSNYLVEVGGKGLAIQVMGSPNSALGLRDYGYNMISFSEIEGDRFKYTIEAGGPDKGRGLVESMSKRVMPDASLMPSNFEGIIESRVTGHRTLEIVRGMESTMMNGLDMGNLVIMRAMGDGVFDVVKNGGKDETGRKLDLFTLPGWFGQKLKGNIDNYSTGQGWDVISPSAVLPQDPMFDPNSNPALPDTGRTR
jgi:hypothetical protein